MNGTLSPRHSFLSVSASRNILALRSAKFAGAMAKSLGCHPDATETPTRPPERLSTTAHSSATRTGECNGRTTLPARICTRVVVAAIAALVTEGFG